MRVTGLVVMSMLGIATGAQASGLVPSVASMADQRSTDRPAGIPSDEELEQAGAAIGVVFIEPDNIFDTSQPEDDTALFRVANKVHPRTRPATIETLLLFRSGDPYSGRQLEESERILRTTRYLTDASIRPVAYHDGLVDVEVRTRDVWTFNPGMSFGRQGGANSGGVQLEELNLLGTGTQLGFGYSSGVDRDSTQVTFRDRQLGDSWWRLAVEAAENSDGYWRELTLEQPFYAMGTPWAAGITAHDGQRIDKRYDLGEAVDEYRAQSRLATVYGGWSRGPVGRWTRRWTAGLSFEESTFDTAPKTVVPANVPADRTLSYPWLGYELLENRYLKTSNRDQIGRTEDVPLGWHAAARIGFASESVGSDRNALVFSTDVDKGIEMPGDTSLLLSGRLNGRYEGAGLANTILSGSARLYHRETPHELSFAGLQVDIGHDLDADAPLQLGGDNGLRGYPLRYQGGEGRWLMTLEQRWYSNWYPFRLFQVGGAAFYDAGGTWGPNPYGSPSLGLLQDVGVGLRLGNNRSALGNVLHIDLAMPLDGGHDISKVQLLIETKASF